MMGNRICGVAILASCVVLAACSSSRSEEPPGDASTGDDAPSGPISTGPIVTASAEPSFAEIDVGQSLSLSVAAIDAHGKPTAAPTLASSAPAIATLAGTSVTGVAPGTTLIQYGTAAGPITVATIVVVPQGTSVDDMTPASIGVSPSLMSLALGAKGAIVAHAYSVAGTPVSAPLTYTSAKTSVATVDGSGAVTAVASGFAAITVSLTAPSAGSDAGGAPDADGTPDAGMPTMAAISATVMVEVLTSGGQEPGADGGGCGAQPVPTDCSFPHGTYDMLVGVKAQMDPVEVTYMCPFSKGFSTAGQWTASALVGINPPITQGGVLGPLPLCGAFTVNFLEPGSLTSPCAATAYVWGQPNWSGEWTCTATSGMSGMMTAGQLTGVPRDGRAICPPDNDPNCCVFDSTDNYQVNTSVSPATCTPVPPGKNLQTWGPDTACSPNGFSYTGSAFVGDVCEKGSTYGCGGGAGGDAGVDAGSDAGNGLSQCCCDIPGGALGASCGQCQCFLAAPTSCAANCQDIFKGSTVVPSCGQTYPCCIDDGNSCRCADPSAFAMCGDPTSGSTCAEWAALQCAQVVSQCPQ